VVLRNGGWSWEEEPKAAGRDDFAAMAFIASDTDDCRVSVDAMSDDHGGGWEVVCCDDEHSLPALLTHPDGSAVHPAAQLLQPFFSGKVLMKKTLVHDAPDLGRIRMRSDDRSDRTTPLIPRVPAPTLLQTRSDPMVYGNLQRRNGHAWS